MNQLPPQEVACDINLAQAGMVTACFNQPVILLDTAFCISSWNTLFGMVCGRLAAIIPGTPFFSVFPEAADNDRVVQALRHSLQGYSSYIPAEDSGEAGSSFDYHFTPLKDRDGRVIGIMHVWHDIAHRIKALAAQRQLNEALMRRNRELVQLTQTLQAVCKAIGTSLYEPLARIHSFIQLLQLSGAGAQLPESGRKHLSRISGLIARSRSLATDLLAYIALDDQREATTDINLNHLFGFIRNSIHAEITRTGATVRWTDLPVVKGKRRLLYQLFLELVRNAIRFRRGDVPPDIVITSSETQVEFLSEERPHLETYVHIRVADNGQGFEPQQAPDLFRLFYKLPAHRLYAGNGIGLALCHKILEKHQGTICAEPGPDGGSVFTCSLPVWTSG